MSVWLLASKFRRGQGPSAIRSVESLAISNSPGTPTNEAESLPASLANRAALGCNGPAERVTLPTLAISPRVRAYLRNSAQRLRVLAH